jgi:hypothetical protein
MPLPSGYRVKERLREFYRCTDIATARAMLCELIERCERPDLPPELNKLARIPEELVRQDLQLPHRPRQQRTHRSLKEPDQAHQTHRVRLHQLRQLPHPSTALRRQTQLASTQLHRRPMNTGTPGKIRRAGKPAVQGGADDGNRTRVFSLGS